MINRRGAFVCLVSATLMATPVLAAGVESWSASTAREFQRGTLDGTALDHEGRIVLAPEMTTLWGPSEGIVWQVAPAGPDAAFVALSGPGRLLRVGPGESQELWKAESESLVTALVEDGKGGAYFGTSPDGQVLHVDSDGTVETLFQAPAAFVWSLATDESGNLWVGTGLPGTLIRLGSNMQAHPVFDSEDDPVRCLAPLPGGGMLLGTGGRGHIVRVDTDDRAFVLYDADEPEIVSIAVAADGTIFALAAQGSKQPRRGNGAPASAAQAPPNAVRVVVTPPQDAEHESSGQTATPRPTPTQKPPSGFKAQPGGGVYRLDTDGGVRRIWTAATDVPFALELDEAGRLIVATGDSGRLWVLDSEGRDSSLLRMPSDQASALARGSDGRILVGGSTDARVEVLGAGPRASGAFLSEAIDAGHVADWGRLRWEVDLPQDAKFIVMARSGNTSEPDDTWSDWVELSNRPDPEGVDTGVPAARFFQTRIDLASRRRGSPAVSRLQVFFLRRNRAPEVQSLGVLPAGIVMVEAPVQSSARLGPVVADDPVSRRTASALTRNSRVAAPTRKSYEAGARTFAWQAADPDGDRLRYSLEIRREGTQYWFPLVRDLDRLFYSWDARGMPNGYYRVRLTAGDDRDNPDGDHLSHTRVSDAFSIDNSRPTVGELKVHRAADGFEVGFVASDPGGSVAAVEVAVDGSDWQPLHPVDGVADSEEERYRLVVDPVTDEARASRALMVRVTDAAGNLGGEMWLLEDVEGGRSAPARP